MDIEKEYDRIQKNSKEAFNALPKEERKKHCSYEIHSHILHLEQGKLKAIKAHKRLINEYNDHIKNLKHYAVSEYR